MHDPTVPAGSPSCYIKLVYEFLADSFSFLSAHPEIPRVLLRFATAGRH